SFIVSDVEDTSSDLLVWLNYSLTGSPPWLPIVGPISGDSSPQVWTVPGVNTTTARVRAEVLDTAGGFGLDMSGSFEIDSSPPSVLNTVPQDNEVDVGVTTSILVVWSEGMNTSSTQLSFSMADNTTWTSVAGLFSWSNDNTTMSFYPTIELEYDTWYTVNLTTASQDDSDPGNNLTSPYSWSFRTSGAPDVTPPRIENISQVPSPVEVFDVINISADIFDESGLSGAWLEIKPPTGPSSNESMTLAYGSRFYRESIWNVLGRYDYTISATDSSGLWSIALGRFDVVDISPPIITDVAVNPDPVELDGLANISATIMDHYELDGVWISIQDPNNQESNQSMELGPRHYYNKMCSVPGSYYFTIWASDSSENWAFASGGFEAVSPEGYIILDEPSQGDQIPTGGTLLLIGWVREVGTDEGFRTELVIRLETTEGDVLGSEKYTTSEANGRIFETFSVPDTILCNSEYVLRVYSNRSYVEDYLVVLKTADCAQPISIWIWLLIILVTVTAPILLALLLVLFRKKRGGEKGEDIEELPAESGEEELDDIKS
ncbi:MAG: Ig-like domain-containing protein, partial [Thermoplasmata archaeon]